MNKLTYKEAITHVRKYKKFYRIGAIADCLDMNQGQLRQVINCIGYATDLPERYREQFVEIVTELTSVMQEVPSIEEVERLPFLESNDSND